MREKRVSDLRGNADALTSAIIYRTVDERAERDGSSQDEAEHNGDHIKDSERQDLTASEISLDDGKIAAERIELLFVHKITPFQI